LNRRHRDEDDPGHQSGFASHSLSFLGTKTSVNIAKQKPVPIAFGCGSRLGLGFRFDLHLFKNHLANEARERADEPPVEAKHPQRRQTEALDPRFGRKNCTLKQISPQLEIPCYLRVTEATKPNKMAHSEIETAPSVGTPESSCDADDNLLTRNIRQNDESRLLESLTEVAWHASAWHPFSTSDGHQEAQ